LRAKTRLTASRRLERTTSSPELAFISPRVARTVLHDHITAPEMNSLGVIKLQPNFTVVNYSIVNGVRFVHGRIFLFKVIR